MAKKVKGRKRHIITDTMGNTLNDVVHKADIQERLGFRRSFIMRVLPS